MMQSVRSRIMPIGCDKIERGAWPPPTVDLAKPIAGTGDTEIAQKRNTESFAKLHETWQFDGQHRVNWGPKRPQNGGIMAMLGAVASLKLIADLEADAVAGQAADVGD